MFCIWGKIPDGEAGLVAGISFTRIHFLSLTADLVPESESQAEEAGKDWKQCIAAAW